MTPSPRPGDRGRDPFGSGTRAFEIVYQDQPISVPVAGATAGVIRFDAGGVAAGDAVSGTLEGKLLAFGW